MKTKGFQSAEPTPKLDKYRAGFKRSELLIASTGEQVPPGILSNAPSLEANLKDRGRVSRFIISVTATVMLHDQALQTQWQQQEAFMGLWVGEGSADLGRARLDSRKWAGFRAAAQGFVLTPAAY